MEKTGIAIIFFLVSLGGQAARASLIHDDMASGANAPTIVDRALDVLLDPQPAAFQAINHFVVIDSAGNLAAPLPGNLFLARGYGTIDSGQADLELSLSYELAGRIEGIDPRGGGFRFSHGAEWPGVANRMTIYADDSPDASENDASTYTDGIRLLDLDLFSDGGMGVLGPLGGYDEVGYLAPLSELKRYRREGMLLFLRLSSVLGEPSFIPAFSGTGGPLTDCVPGLSFCGRETGVIVSQRIIIDPMPVPPVSALLVFGIGLWRRGVRRGGFSRR